MARAVVDAPGHSEYGGGCHYKQISVTIIILLFLSLTALEIAD
jgi:hypothetical protein